uniref:G_PROTEIN_RECEP_F1_2 domain-containing protein n=1 Tax=Caenorhabditis japonica TaxID=281687 RepID=A0A8R1ELP0_CAEJA
MLSLHFSSTKHVICSMDAALRKVITTVLLLTAIYVLCWTPYWVSMFANRIWTMERKSIIIISYFIHLLPYISCVAYPLIFTLLNRGIRSAHAKIVADQRRRFRSLTDEASSQIRTAIRTIPGPPKPKKSDLLTRTEEMSSDKIVSEAVSEPRETLPSQNSFPDETLL